MPAQLGDRLALIQKITEVLGRGEKIRLYLKPINTDEKPQAIELGIGPTESFLPDIARVAILATEALDALSGVYEAMGGEGLMLVEVPSDDPMLSVVNKETGEVLGEARRSEVVGAHLQGNYDPMITFRDGRHACYVGERDGIEVIFISLGKSPYA